MGSALALPGIAPTSDAPVSPVAEWLDEQWREMRNDASRPAKMWICGAVALAEHIGQLTAEQGELWRRRIETCPGHDDEGGRDWCAYCGVMPRENEEGEVMERQCTCGHVEDEHGGDPEHPTALACAVEGCDCIAFEADEDAERGSQ